MGMGWLSKHLLFNTLNMRQYWKWNFRKKKISQFTTYYSDEWFFSATVGILTFSSSILNRSWGLNWWIKDWEHLKRMTFQSNQNVWTNDSSMCLKTNTPGLLYSFSPLSSSLCLKKLNKLVKQEQSSCSRTCFIIENLLWFLYLTWKISIIYSLFQSHIVGKNSQIKEVKMWQHSRTPLQTSYCCCLKFKLSFKQQWF